MPRRARCGRRLPRTAIWREAQCQKRSTADDRADGQVAVVLESVHRRGRQRAIASVDGPGGEAQVDQSPLQRAHGGRARGLTVSSSWCHHRVACRLERSQGVGACNTVNGQTGRRLEPLHRAGGQRAIASVDGSGGEAQMDQPPLERAHPGRACGLVIAGARDQDMSSPVPGLDRWAPLVSLDAFLVALGVASARPLDDRRRRVGAAGLRRAVAALGERHAWHRSQRKRAGSNCRP